MIKELVKVKEYSIENWVVAEHEILNHEPERVYRAADLFCGAGGTSTGFLQACAALGVNVWLAAINHNKLAIDTHSLNHPKVKHINSDLEKVDPREVVPWGWLDLLMASPECTHFSRAAAGRPVNAQSRATVKYVLRWISALRIESVSIENVAEFMEWGPLHRICTCKAPPVLKTVKRRVNGKTEYIDKLVHEKKCKKDKAIKSRKGEYFYKFINKLKEHGYSVEYKVLNAENYGDPTTRRRLFIRARLSGRPSFPAETHRQILSPSRSRKGSQLNIPGFEVKEPVHLKPWIPARDIINWKIKGTSIFNRKKPLVKNTMRKIAQGLFQFGGRSFVIGQQSGSAPRDAGSMPLPTIAQAGGISICEPYIVEYHNGKSGHKRVRPVDQPLPTLDTSNRFGLAEPFIIQMDQGGILHSIDKTFPTITSADAWAIVEPYIIEYYGNGRAESVNKPLKTVTGKPRFGLVEPIIFEHDGRKYMIDILFRMLTPEELAAAMSFPAGYQFAGNREEKVKQIGNAVAVKMAAALAHAAITNEWAYYSI